jgi:transposase
MEHTGVYHLKLANYLYENGYKVAVVNPFSIKKK